MDRLTPEQRHKNMSAVKCKGSKIERTLGQAMWHSGLRYRKNDTTILGKPDFSFKKLKIVVFCDSEFWHGQNWNDRIGDLKSNRDFWIPKIEKNIARDKYVTDSLCNEGWIVLRFWGSDIMHNTDKCLNIIKYAIAERK